MTFCLICVIQFRMSIQETVQSNTLNHTVQANAWPTLKRVIIGHVIHHQNAHGSTIIRYQVVMSGQSSLLRVSPVVMSSEYRSKTQLFPTPFDQQETTLIMTKCI
ncbi:unnamed protein product [Albugo candida]|uniref:Uncharacterized protein n=1 Tax=Albugo candida TaxID=65357 RepID=A0A024GH50_9STRA|nr:unnamed protein product [Albugo candida]|eukprot:CCI46213.1 unnamed protein product [Albugo candida]